MLQFMSDTISSVADFVVQFQGEYLIVLLLAVLSGVFAFFWSNFWR